MRLFVLSLIAVLVLGGCSSTTLREADGKKSAQVNAELGLRYMLQGNNALALEKLEKALEQDFRSALAHHYLAELYRRLDKPDEADKHFRRAAALDPRDSSIANNYGVFLCSRKRYQEAEKQFLNVLENPVYTGRAQTLENLGLCLRAGGEQTKAEDYFRRALQADPRMGKSLLEMAELSHLEGNPLSARGYLQRYSEVAVHTPRSAWLGVQIERILGDKGAADSFGLLLKNKFPDSVETGHYLRSEKR